MLLTVSQAFVPVPGKAADSAAHSSSDPQRSGNNDKNPSPSPTGQGNRAIERERNAGNALIVSELAPMPKRDLADWILWVGELLLVIIGGIGVGVAWYTATVAKKSADAALLNAQAVISAERAWISVTPHMGEVKFYPLRDKNAPVPDNLVDVLPIAHLFPARMVNVGKTPAKIEGSAIHYVRTTIHPCELDETPDYGVLSKYVHFAFPDEILTLSSELSPIPTLTEEQIKAIQAQKEFLYAFGIVKYSDVYGNRHETRFGYIYQVQDSHLVMKDGVIETIRTGEARFRIGGPPAYNGHT